MPCVSLRRHNTACSSQNTGARFWSDGPYSIVFSLRCGRDCINVSNHVCIFFSCRVHRRLRLFLNVSGNCRIVRTGLVVKHCAYSIPSVWHSEGGVMIYTKLPTPHAPVVFFSWRRYGTLQTAKYCPESTDLRKNVSLVISQPPWKMTM